MARTHELTSSSDPVEAAIARVLAAEGAARDSVASAQEAALARDEHTRATIRALTRRTQDRIAAVRARFARDTAERVAALDAEGERIANAPALCDDTLAALDAALAALAAELTGDAR